MLLGHDACYFGTPIYNFIVFCLKVCSVGIVGVARTSPRFLVEKQRTARVKISTGAFLEPLTFTSLFQASKEMIEMKKKKKRFSYSERVGESAAFL